MDGGNRFSHRFKLWTGITTGTIDSREHGLNLPEKNKTENQPDNRRKV